MSTSSLSTVFAALADPTRRAILAQLANGEAPVKDLVAPFDLSGPAMTKHLKVLERAGLISRGRDGAHRPCRLEPQALAPAADWIDQYRAMWEAQLDRLDAYLKSVVEQPVRSTSRRATADVNEPGAGSRKTRKQQEPAKRARRGADHARRTK